MIHVTSTAEGSITNIVPQLLDDGGCHSPEVDGPVLIIEVGTVDVRSLEEARVVEEEGDIEVEMCTAKFPRVSLTSRRFKVSYSDILALSFCSSFRLRLIRSMDPGYLS